MGSFYLGASYGNQTLSAEGKETILGQEISAKIDLATTIVTPHLGWMWSMADGGFFFGLDLGLQQNSGAKPTLTTNAPGMIQGTQEYQDLESDMQKQAEKYGNGSLPLITLFRIGYLF